MAATVLKSDPAIAAMKLVSEAERAMTGGDLDRFVGVLERLGAA